MDRKERALKRILQKLGAVRQVLSKEERVWLDRLVLGPEVEGHLLSTNPKQSLRPRIHWDAKSATYVVAEETESHKKNRD